MAAPASPIEEAAARGELPAWARVSVERRAHLAHVAGLLGAWAVELDLPAPERTRWAAAGWLHDALRDADPAELRSLVPPELRDLPDPLLHGPAVAARLEGRADPRLRDAIRYHTLGHPRLERLGRALYLADFLEPGRPCAAAWRAGLRARLPREMDAVLLEVAAERIRHLLDRRRPLRAETAAFWSALAAGDDG